MGLEYPIHWPGYEGCTSRESRFLQVWAGDGAVTADLALGTVVVQKDDVSSAVLIGPVCTGLHGGPSQARYWGGVFF